MGKHRNIIKKLKLVKCLNCPNTFLIVLGYKSQTKLICPDCIDKRNRNMARATEDDYNLMYTY